MVIPINILIASFLTLVALLCKLSEQIGLVQYTAYMTPRKATLSIVIGAAVALWVIAIFGKYSIASIITGVIIGAVCAAYNAGNSNSSGTDNNDGDTANAFVLVGKKGTITNIVDDSNSDKKYYIGKLRETGEDIIVHIDEEANVGDDFVVATIDKNGQILAEII